MELHGKIPPRTNKPAAKRTEAENLDQGAYQYIWKHKWTQAEVDALPDSVRGIVTRYHKKQQAGAKQK